MDKQRSITRQESEKSTLENLPTHSGATVEGKVETERRAYVFPPIICYTEAESEAAFKEWKAQCGPHSIAAACGLKLEAVREAMIAAGITHKGWMSPTYVSRTLDQLGRKYALTTGLKTMDLCEGINRVQWEGKWLDPGVPARVAYFHTHLVAHFSDRVLCTCCENTLWIDADDWRDFHLNTEPKSPFHITHHWKFSP